MNWCEDPLLQDPLLTLRSPDATGPDGAPIIIMDHLVNTATYFLDGKTSAAGGAKGGGAGEGEGVFESRGLVVASDNLTTGVGGGEGWGGGLRRGVHYHRTNTHSANNHLVHGTPSLLQQRMEIGVRGTR